MKTMTFGELEIGDVFETEDYDNIFMKTEVAYGKYSVAKDTYGICKFNAVSLWSSEDNGGVHWHFSDDTMVTETDITFD